MDLEYDRKFEEMKKYIPFLESMIKRLESTNNGVKNPRKAQLDKIRSLRDLLLDKKKRMKMENLLKCEQVLVNLYAKVEQRDSMTDNKEDCTEQTQKDKSDLNMVRNKLKSVVSKLQDDVPETLPEIARATNTEVVCTPGSKEPALFQRRPNKVSPVRGSSGSHKDDLSPNSKRHYTRVLMSPDHKKKDWLTNSDTNNDKPLYSRRSPRRSPRRHSPSYKRERKKSSKQRSKSSQDSKDLNITLKVPEESLGSLNTKDILSRIINCSDSDVDIDTLRGLRSQILGELKQTGTNDDISDLILKSYKKKEKNSKRTDEVEEGELSDSESETIENIYGSLVVVDKSEGDTNSINKISSDKKKPRKIQICLVINSDKEKECINNDQVLNTTLDVTDFESYTDTSTASKASSMVSVEDRTMKESIEKDVIEKENNTSLEEKKSALKIVEETCNSPKQDENKIENIEISSNEKPKISSTEKFKPNFYQSSIEEKKDTEECVLSQNLNKSINEVVDEKKEVTVKPTEVVKSPVPRAKTQTKTKKEVVSEIDILQALKKEILGETGTVPIPEVITPPLHQPKITKVASAHEIVSKKRISIENYKQKSVPSITQPLFKPVKQQSSLKDDNLKKQSLKLTEKECERFNFPVNVSPVDSSEDEDKQKWDYELLHGAPKSPDSKNKDKSPVNFENLRGSSAPKSPDHEDFADTGIKPPVIIPSDPVKNIVPNAKVDIDMRTLMPLISPVSLEGSRKNIPSPSLNSEKMHEATWNENGSNNEKVRKSVQEFRMRAESNQSTAKNSPNSYVTDSDRGQRPGTSYSNVPASMPSNIPPLMSLNPNPNVISNLNQIMTPILNSPIPLLLNPNMTPNMTPTLNPLLVQSMNPNMTPSRMMPGMNPMMTPIMTPNSRSYEMTPRPNFDADDYTNQKHVYAPMFRQFEPHDFSEKDTIQVNQSNESTKWEDRNCPSTSVQRDVDYHRNRNDRYIGDKRLDSPQIRMECPATPNPSFGRMECPSTPNPSFGRMECPSTPNPSFGRMESPMTPVHSFGRSDCPMTPSHPFGRSDTNMTPTNGFGRDYHHSTTSYNHNYIKSHDPRLHRSNDYDKCQSRSYDERNQSYFEDDHKMTDNANRYRRSQVKPYEHDSHNSRGRMLRQESSIRRSVSRDYETDESYNDYHYRRESYKCSDDLNNERHYRSRSIGRKSSPLRDTGVGKTFTKEESMEKPISVQSHTGRSFDIDTSFNRTFQETKSTLLDKSFNARRQRASSVGRALCESPRKDTIERCMNKNDFLHVSDRKTMQFRRACSVGRDLIDYNANKNFKDIKEDLRSCKFNNYDFTQRERDQKTKSRSSYSNEKNSSKEYHSSRDTRISNSSFLKSTGHQISRDPRKKLRDYDMNSTKHDDSSKYSPRKNFRDPRMRREIDAKSTNKDRYKDKERNSSSSRHKNYGIVYSSDNIAKGTILAPVSGVKNFKIPKIKRAVEEKVVENKSQSETDIKKKESFKNVKKVGNSITDKTKKRENKIIRSESAFADKRHEVENNSKNIAIKVDKPKSKEDKTSINKIPDKVQNHDENTPLANIISDSSERRITRSAVKAGTSSNQISSTSPVKKLRRIKKPLVYDSDSDTQESESDNKNMKISTEKDIKIDEERKLEKDLNQNDDTTSMEQNNSPEEDAHTNTNNNPPNSIKEKSAPISTKESREGQNDTLDISFGVDDDLFSDNIASGSVLDNINALIADLDNDIEAPKINDFNDKFINNIVGRVSSNNSPIPSTGNRTDFTSDLTLHDKVGFVVDVENVVKECTAQIVNSQEETDKIDASKCESNSGRGGIHNKCEEIKNNEAEDVGTSIQENTEKPVFQEENVTGSIGESEGGIKTQNLDAIVSTTARDEKSDDSTRNLQCSSNNIIPCVSQFVPDSTINLSETNTNTGDNDLQESIPDSTNELSSEMNISSTNNSNDMPSKEQSANSTCADNLPRIDSINKLLSILEDKNKIKELLTFLSNDSGENEKIKKKLEKLSEIVSDEEENPKEADYDIKTQNQKRLEGTLTKCDNIVAEESENDDNSKNHQNADKKVDKDSDKGETIVGIQCYNEKVKDTTKIDNEIADINKELPENKLQTDIKSVENKNISVDVIRDITDSNVDKEAEENDTTKEYKDVTDIVQDDIQISKVNERENNLTDKLPVEHKSGKKVAKKSKITKRGRSRLAKKYFPNKDKRVTRSEAGSSQPQIPPVPKKPSRELLKLQEDIRDMFISEDILNATGIRMCRLAKLVDSKNSKDETPTVEVEPEPIVVLENIKSKMPSDDSINSIEKNNKRKTKSKSNTVNDTLIVSESKQKPKYKPGPKSKTQKQDDPYIFETESIGESNNTVDSKEHNTDSDSDSLSTKSFGSVETLAELKKKPKRKRRSWQLGVIKKKGIKIKSAVKSSEFITPDAEDFDKQETKEEEKNTNELPDYNCFTDKSYCFHKNVKNYMCRLCGYRGNDIVPHYKKHHPHSEIPLSRLSPLVAKEAIQQCENMNLQAISKIQTLKYVCRFCFQDFHKQNTALETFFWHVVSMHTGEYKHLCSECINITRCPFNLDIPPPPKNVRGQLIGYICGRCNFTQVSLENLKTHVIIRHDDEQTEVYSINLGDIPRKMLESLITKVSESSVEVPRMLRSTRSNQSITEPSDRSDITESTDHIDGIDTGRDNTVQDNITKVPSIIAPKNKIQSKFSFENDDSDASSYSKNDEMLKASIKLEKDEDAQDATKEALESHKEPVPDPQPPIIDNVKNATVLTELTSSTGVLDYPHYKIKVSGTGAKEYVCCINGLDNHYKTTLLISLKKHVQFKHSENWDGYCSVCKVIVTSQGKHTFNDCLQHFLVKHMDNFPILEEPPGSIVQDVPLQTLSTVGKEATISKSYINVRPLSELISKEQNKTREVTPQMPKIQQTLNLGSSDYISTETEKDTKEYKYEEAQSEVMANKHRVVLEAMLNPEKLIHLFKCAGRFCSYTTDNAEEALLHASTHQRIGGECSLKCAYCDFDSSGNAIDLVMHVFKKYTNCSYACSKCFYRAAGSQLVYAHIKRIHPEVDPDNVPVLSSGMVLRDDTTDEFNTREEAVLYYTCNNRDPDEGGVCQLKTYVKAKFREHLQIKHADDKEFICYMCNIIKPTWSLLMSHLKTHGLGLYQCCRCLYGADNEAGLLAHASEKHPLKPPKAYLRIITTKDDSPEVRVLPLAILGKFIVQATMVAQCVNKESPVKQAERSIDLEKLIGLTNLTVESMSTITNETTVEPLETTDNENQIQLEKEQAYEISQEEAERSSPAVLTLLRDTQDTLIEPTAIVKSESVEIEKTTSDILPDTPISAPSAQPQPDVVCLDSDDDSSRQNIIDLSIEDTPVELNSTKKQENADIKIPRIRLYKCSKCLLVSKSEGMFKRHILSCFPDPNEIIQCAHCSFTTAANEILVHYHSNHVESPLMYACGICDDRFLTLAVARKHMKVVHNETSISVKSKTSSTGVTQYVVEKDPKERQTLKRKLSGDTAQRNSEPASKLKKYGPQDVEKLPINPILDDLVYCSLCKFSTKVRLNMVRHLQLHAEQQPVPITAPVNPVPHLESNEKHFDKMLNLASSSITNSNRTGKDGTNTTFEYLSPEAAAIYPKYVADNRRYTCGAKDCSYISLNETMFKIHWDTLHAGTNNYHCVHCLPHQQLNTAKALTALRIIAHLKMHDVKLYGCSSCTFYHYTRKVIEKHLKEKHNGKIIIVREDGAPLPPTPPPPVQAAPVPAPTMDLKPWQCGLCKFKSMIRPEVIEHCGKFHQSKMQFKCTYCGFRTSNIENISKHQSKQHPGKKEEVFYFYYREGSIPDEADGTARWQKQSQKTETVIKTETDIPPPDSISILPRPAQAKPSNLVNLDIVKKEVFDPDLNVSTDNSVESLCQMYGQICDPNGLKYKCSLCKVIIEDTKEAMQSHLYEELQYRKWGCTLCSYKAFHKPGLQHHVLTEHKYSRKEREPIELQVDAKIEAWVTNLLEHQTAIIERNKANLAKQKVEILRSNPGTSTKPTEKPVESPSAAKPSMSMVELEKLFGPFGVPNNMNYMCPKCNISAKTEDVMQEHLEGELNKIRWCCNICSVTFQTYHEAQFHCRSVHPGQSSRPVEATRDVSLRAAWVAAVLRVQKLSMNFMPVTEPPTPEIPAPQTDNPPENSLLVVRYEEKVPTPEEQMKLNKKADKDEGKITTDNVEKRREFECEHCMATYKHESFFHSHVLKHYGMKPFTCPYCPHTDQKKSMEAHIRSQHPNRIVLYIATAIPTNPPVHDYMTYTTPTSKTVVIDIESKLICLGCEETMTRVESQSHFHDNVRPQFGMRGAVVYRCWTCLTLHKTSNDFNVHHKQFHPAEKKNSSFYKLSDESRSLFCSLCNQNFVNMAQYRSHQQMKHGLKSFMAIEPLVPDVVIELDDEVEGGKRKAVDVTIFPVAKRVAKKSTTKLPTAMTVARKSTTKLPFNVSCDDEEYSFYGTQPSMDNLENVTTLMPFYNTFVPFTLKKLSEIIKIYPVVVVKDINKQ